MSTRPSRPLPSPRTCWLAGDGATIGLTRTQLASLARSGELVRPVRGVYLRAEDADDAWLVAYGVCERLGPDCVVGHDTAGALWGIRAAPVVPVHVVLPHRRALDRRGDLIPHHAELSDSDVAVLGGLRLTTVERTAVDLARRVERAESLTVLDAALRTGRCSMASLQGEVVRHGGRRGIVQVRQLLPLADGRAESPMESRMRLQAVESGLPAVVPQLAVPEAGARVDLGIPEYGVALEYASLRHHGSDAAAQRDRDRDRRLLVAGWLTLHVTARDVLGHPGRWIRECAGLLIRRGWSPSSTFRHQWL